MHTKETTPAASNNAGKKKKEYDRYTMVVYYTYAHRRRNGNVEKETKRADITTLQFENRGIVVTGWHPLAVLSKLFLELKPMCASAFFYDNWATKGRQLVCKLVTDHGKEEPFGDRREEYYDMQTKRPHDTPINSMPNQNV
jgi:hypothetical protein